jgi:hypothetical protein
MRAFDYCERKDVVEDSVGRALPASRPTRAGGLRKKRQDRQHARCELLGESAERRSAARDLIAALPNRTSAT